ncbi:hypothetical protein Q8A67_020026 [Cirrhinus molitorella]|uniref:Uncharacterized protein n=1 Tax=Cirrhinus molitorella TaxID=172907 RepID=A0AA88TFN0_9TELE|nr:hypothetical protein Q8A67_020026 [Cirrhinus molitorella]
MLRVNNARPAKATQIYSLSASFISHIQLFHASFKNNILRLMSERGYENLRTDALRLSSVCLTEIRPSAGVIRLRADGQRIEFPIAVTADGLDYKRHNATENQDQSVSLKKPSNLDFSINSASLDISGALERGMLSHCGDLQRQQLHLRLKLQRWRKSDRRSTTQGH